MSAKQLTLLAPARPLLERFGAEFFRAIPPRPGIYIMGDHTDRVLYVGQSKNLRQRLGSYKNARPHHAPRKVIRLVHQIRTIVWEECDTAAAARLKENELLRLHRPKFNVVNTWPKANGFISLDAQPNSITFHVTNNPEQPGLLFGAFKSGYHRAVGALLRMLWTVIHESASVFDLPAQLLREKPPRQYCLMFAENSANFSVAQCHRLLEKFFSGESDELLEVFSRQTAITESAGVFQKNFHTNDLEILTNFFVRGPKRNHGFRQRHAISEPIIPQELLDDLLAIEAPQRRTKADESSASQND